MDDIDIQINEEDAYGPESDLYGDEDEEDEIGSKEAEAHNDIENALGMLDSSANMDD